MFSFCSSVHSAITWQFCRMAGIVCFVLILPGQFSVRPVMAQPQAESTTKPIHLEYRLNENSVAGTVVDTLAEQYPDLSHFRLSTDDPASAFTLDHTSGRIAVREGAVLDYESRTLHSLAIQADVNPAKEDPFLREFAGSLLEEGIAADHLNQLLASTRTISVRIRLRNVPEAPRLTGSSFEIPRNSPVGSIVGTLSAEDPDSDEVLRYSILNGDHDNLFTIDPNSGKLSVTAGQALDFETQPVHQLIVQVCDRDGLTADADVTVRVTDVNEQPPAPIVAEAVNDELPEESVQPADVSPINGSTETAVAAGTDSRSEKRAKTAGMVTDADLPPGSDPSATGPTVADVLQEMMAEADTDPQSAPQTVTTEKTDVRTPNWLEQQVQSATGVSEVAVAATATPASAKEPTDSTYLWDLAVLVIILSGVGFFFARMYQQASDARKEALREKEMDDANRRSAVLAMYPPDSGTEDSVQTRSPDHTDAAGAEKVAGFDENCLSLAPVLDPESFFSEDYFNEEERSVAGESTTMALPGDDRQHEPEIPKLNSMTLEQQNRLESVSRGLETETAQFGRDRRVRDDNRHESNRSMAGISEDQQDEIPAKTSRRNDSDVRNDPRESLTRARDNVVRMLDQLVSPESSQPEKRGPEANSESAATAGRSAEEPASPAGGAVGCAASTGQTSEIAAGSIPDAADRPEPAAEADLRSSEETHLDSVAEYLSHLLERSNKGDGADDIFVDRRKSGGKWDGVDKRAKPKSAQPVKSYIESYLREHGGQLHQDLAELQQLHPSAKVSAAVEEPQPPVVRTPVDVSTIRTYMNSFREVASRSVENALDSYNRRQAKSKLAWRSALASTLAILTVGVIATSASKAIQFTSLKWLMGAIVLLIVAELCLRVQSIRRRSAFPADPVEAQKKAASHKGGMAKNLHDSILPVVKPQLSAEPGKPKERKQDQRLLPLS